MTRTKDSTCFNDFLKSIKIITLFFSSHYILFYFQYKMNLCVILNTYTLSCEIMISKILHPKYGWSNLKHPKTVM